MALGSRRSHGDDEYIFVDGRAVKADEVIRIEVDAPGQNEAEDTPQSPVEEDHGRFGRLRDRLNEMNDADAMELRPEFVDEVLTTQQTSRLMADDRHKMRRKYLLWGIILVALVVFSLCISEGYSWRIYSPLDVFASIGDWFYLRFIDISSHSTFAMERAAVIDAHPMYLDVTAQFGSVFRDLLCGAVLAISGMLYQNAFRNPIAAPSMMGISNGVNFGMLIFVLIFQEAALHFSGLYYVFAYAGGVGALLLVLLLGRLMSGKQSFNVVNLLLMATVVSQLLNVLSSFIQAEFMSSTAQTVVFELQSADVDVSIWTYVTLAAGVIVSIAPVIAFRFRLNLISFSDEETRLLGANPQFLRVIALACGSLMLLTAQVNIGQVAMASLIVPFAARYVFGSEFRKQLAGSCILGMIVILFCADITSLVYVNQYIELTLGTVVTFVMLPLFVWMLAIGQRSWE